jgi:transcriptional regulator with XRE-family HTH domain
MPSEESKGRGHGESKEVDKQIGERIRARRLLLKMSQSTLAQKIGLTFQQVQKYEKGANRISGSRVIDIARAMRCEPAYFFGDSNGRSPGDELHPLVQRPDAVRLLRAFDRVDGTKVRGMIVGLIEDLGTLQNKAATPKGGREV